MNEDYILLADKLRVSALGQMNAHRLKHTLGCEMEAVRLARYWGADEDKARLAAILHDITKGFNYEQQLHLCRVHGIDCAQFNESQAKILHAVTGAAVAAALYTNDDDIISAIRWHTTGRPNMSTLEKVIYLADYTEPNRDFDGVEAVRNIAYKNLDSALLLALKTTLDEIISAGATVHPDTIDAIKYLESEMEKDYD